MRKMTLVALIVLALTSMACRTNWTFHTEPKIKTGPMQEYQETTPLGDTEEARVEVRQEVGELALGAGDPETLFSGQFRTNVAQWAPTVTWEEGALRIEQGHTDGSVDSDAENEWDLSFSPSIPLDVSVDLGAGLGDLDLSGLTLTGLSLRTGAAELDVRCDTPNPGQLEEMTVEIGAADLRIDGIGNANPERMTVRGGVGNVVLDFGGAWSHSTTVGIDAGVGAVSLRLPENVGVRVEAVSGLNNVDADSEFTRSGDAYVNDAYGEAEINILVEVRTGLGSVELQSTND